MLGWSSYQLNQPEAPFSPLYMHDPSQNHGRLPNRRLLYRRIFQFMKLLHAVWMIYCCGYSPLYARSFPKPMEDYYLSPCTGGGFSA
jgi:hypothetical protein